MAIVQNANIMNLLKTVYLSGVTNSLYQTSPVLASVKRENWGSGKEIKYAATYGRGGDFGSDYAMLANAARDGVKNAEWTMTQGYLTGLFDINMPEILTTAEERGAYMKALHNKMFACYEGLSQTLAMYLYGGKYGVIDQLKTGVSIVAGTNTIAITSAGALKLDVGSKFVIASNGADNTALPSSNLLNAIMTVTAIDDYSVTFTSTAAVTAYAGDYIELYTARNGTSVQGVEGFAEIIPSYGDRDSSDTRWTNYITQAFRGWDRSVAVNRLAGQFAKAESTGDTRLTDALVTLLKKTKRAGGLNDIIVINDETWDAIGQELGIQRNLWQATNSGENKNRFTAGYSELATAFGDAFIGRTVIDPYCTEGNAYMYDKDDLTLYDLGNVSKVIEPVSNGQLGKVGTESVGDQGIGDSPANRINIDKLFTVTEGVPGSYGPSLSIAAHLFLNFALRKTSSSGVAVLK